MKEYIERESAINAVTKNDCEGYATWAIKSIPAADVRPVVKARWLNLTPPEFRTDKKSVFWMCSECRDAAVFLAEDLPYNFCPNCGAMMEES